MSLAYIDRLEEQLPEVLADDHIEQLFLLERVSIIFRQV